MLGIDNNSFIIISAAFGLLCGFLFFSVRVGFPKTIAGLSEWGWACLLMVIAALGFTTRGKLPVLFSSYFPNLLIPFGVIVMHRSLAMFGNLTVSERPLFALLCGASVALGWVTFVVDDYGIRVIIVSALLTVLFGACSVSLTRYHLKRFPEWFTCSMYATTALVMGARCVSALVSGQTLIRENDTSTIHDLYILAFPFSLVAMSLGFLLMANRALQGRLELQALHDPMSGALRRDAFLETVEREIAVSRRYGSPLSLLITDLDNFKAINDTYGHLIGDKVITNFSAQATQLLRAQDVIGRYGGEEFVVLLPQTGIEAALAIANRICTCIAETNAKGVPPYTVSIGAACLNMNNPDLLSLLDAADMALYAAKRAGKNRAIAAPMKPAV
ncbi:GGDEF domain-containing protein [Massilia litorea]|jgi:diguanylate cyclase (GGDEF)-like protein|uniref:diguanylate cyclase n=1 Tax=Massilia litorea TaxID=2769491 RepID=A0A7L9UBU6_9BURK|nr:diguanylate cyclase [Massilia litorea]QOL52280.1 diguanylate cyclase [Massilia litorea]